VPQAWQSERWSRAYDTCDFALSRHIKRGNADTIDVSGLSVVLAGSCSDDEPSSPWRVILYVDEQATQAQHAALADIFLGRSGGGTLRNFARTIGEVYAVRTARIELDHTPNHERMNIAGLLTASTVSSMIHSGVVRLTLFRECAKACCAFSQWTSLALLSCESRACCIASKDARNSPVGILWLESNSASPAAKP